MNAETNMGDREYYESEVGMDEAIKDQRQDEYKSAACECFPPNLGPITAPISHLKPAFDLIV